MAKPRGRGRVKKKKGGAVAPRKRRPLLAPEELDWKNFPSLRRFLSERGKLRSRRITGLSRRQQTQLAQAVKRARMMGLLPYPDQDRSVRAHASTHAPVPAAPEEGTQQVPDEVVVTEVTRADGSVEIVVDEILVDEVVEADGSVGVETAVDEVVAVGATDAAEGTPET